MSRNAPAEMLMQSMVELASKELMAGNYADAIRSATTSIGSVEDNTPRARQVFGPTLVPLYCLRARAYWEAGQQGHTPDKLDRARQDVAQAHKALSAFYPATDAAKLQSLRLQIDNVLSPDEKTRNDRLQAVMQATTPGGARRGSSARATPAGGNGAPPILAMGAYFIVGVIYWVVAMAIMAGVLALLGPGLSSSSASAATVVMVIVALVACAPFYFGITFAFEGVTGHRNMRRAQGAGILLLAFTVIGLIPVCYWSGKAIVRRYYGDL